MATHKFNTGVESIFMGLFRDANTNVSYEYVKTVWEAYTEWATTEDEDAVLRFFIELVRLGESARVCIKEKDTATACGILVEICSEVCGGAIKNIVMSLGDDELFKSDAERKTWKRIQKLVYICNLQGVVTCEKVLDEGGGKRTKAQKREDEVSHIVQSRVTRFNTAYRSLLETVGSAFPEEDGSASVSCLAKFDEIVGEQEYCDTVIVAFKEKLLPMVPEIAKTAQATDTNAAAKVFYEYFGRESRWFCELPLISMIPVDLHWKTQMYVDEDREPLFKKFREVPTAERDTWWAGLAQPLTAPYVTPDMAQKEKQMSLVLEQFKAATDDAVKMQARMKYGKLVEQCKKLDKQPEPDWYTGIPALREGLVGVDLVPYKADFTRVDTNQMTIMKALGDLACCMSGLDMLIYSPIIKVLKEKAAVYTAKNKITPDQLLPNSETFDRGVAMGFVMSLLDTIPEATGYKISKSDMETIIANTMAGNPDYPDSFNEVFNAGMLDMDCLESLMELPGIGDALGPIMTSMQGQMTGVTGARPAFGSVAAPAWLERDGQ
jgi:hypothetical protein